MKKKHHSSLKFHTIYSIVVSIIFLVIILLIRDITLGLTMTFLVLYIVGNGIIHAKKNELNHDVLLEYIIVSIIVLVIAISLAH
jgi:hypothetical protein